MSTLTSFGITVTLISCTSIHILLLFFHVLFSACLISFVIPLCSFVHDPSGLLFLLRSAVPSVPAARVHLVLRHFLIYWSGERKAIGGRHRITLASHLQLSQTLVNRFVAMCSSHCPINPNTTNQASLPFVLCYPHECSLFCFDAWIFLFS